MPQFHFLLHSWWADPVSSLAWGSPNLHPCPRTYAKFCLSISVWMTNWVVTSGSRNGSVQTHKTRSILFFVLLPTALTVVSQEDLKTSHNRHDIHANLQERGRDRGAPGLEGGVGNRSSPPCGQTPGGIWMHSFMHRKHLNCVSSCLESSVTLLWKHRMCKDVRFGPAFVGTV